MSRKAFLKVRSNSIPRMLKDKEELFQEVGQNDKHRENRRVNIRELLQGI